MEVVTGPYGPEKQERVVIATTDPLTLPDLTTFYLITNLPAPGSQRAQESPPAPASSEEVVRLYGLHLWVEQSYKHVKHALGWSQYQVRSDKAMRRHWQLACCAFSFCWYHAPHPAANTTEEVREPAGPEALLLSNNSAEVAETGKKSAREKGCGHSCPSQWRCEPCEHGWNPGSCSGATGTGGRPSPHLLLCNSCWAGLSEATFSVSTVLLNPRQQTTGRSSAASKTSPSRRRTPLILRVSGSSRW